MKFFSYIFLLSTICVSNTNAQTIYTYKTKDGDLFITDQKQKRYTGDYVKIEETIFPEANVHQYKNWGTQANELSVPKGFESKKNLYDSLIIEKSAKYQINPNLVKAVMHTESGFNHRAISPVGARGLMQLMPATAKRFSVLDPFDPHQNIEGGIRYLKWLDGRFNGDTRLILAAYNAGEGAVKKYNGIPPYKETREYVDKVLSRYQNIYLQASRLQGTNLQTRNTFSK